ncbi:hypothetical protein O181_009865 [Austropuccinia psidii MF-1]|uniref:Uncharacterized protein n=1 Tax=Austropuccinia psidii MF-1 TaxID=1389203 RepID=A0A9Q3BS32_9BASI|nr:hypothetical protein [Austropuccinia psidii MF-1]
MKQKTQNKLNLKHELATNTAYRITDKLFTPNTDISTRSYFLHDAGTIKATSVTKTIDNCIMVKEVITKEDHSSNPDSKRINTNTIKTNSNFSPNQPDANGNKIYKNDEQNLQPNTSCTSFSTNEIRSVTTDATITKDNNNQISDYISYRSPYLVTPNKNATTSLKHTRNINLNISNSDKRTNATITVNEEETILIKIVTYIERKIINQTISTKKSIKNVE